MKTQLEKILFRHRLKIQQGKLDFIGLCYDTNNDFLRYILSHTEMCTMAEHDGACAVFIGNLVIPLQTKIAIVSMGTAICSHDGKFPEDFLGNAEWKKVCPAYYKDYLCKMKVIKYIPPYIVDDELMEDIIRMWHTDLLEGYELWVSRQP